MSTWKAPSDLSEAKHFAVAIYNIAMVGGIAYFLSEFLSKSSTSGSVVLKAIGIFASSTLSVVLIMTPKLLAIEGIFVPKFLTSHSVAPSSAEKSMSGGFVNASSADVDALASIKEPGQPYIPVRAKPVAGLSVERLGGTRELFPENVDGSVEFVDIQPPDYDKEVIQIEGSVSTERAVPLFSKRVVAGEDRFDEEKE